MWKKSIFTGFLMIFFFALVPNQIQAEVSYEQTFKAEELPVGILLQWSTLNEVNNKSFVIEKSEDGKEFSVLGTKASAGDGAGKKDYRFLDVNARGKTLYYRLKEVDTNENFEYTEVVSIGKKTPNNFDILQMSDVASADDFSVTLDVYQNGMLSYELKDWKSNVHYSGERIVIEGMNSVDIDISDFHAGIYKLVLKVGEEEDVVTIRKTATDIDKPNVASLKKDQGN